MHPEGVHDAAMKASRFQRRVPDEIGGEGLDRQPFQDARIQDLDAGIGIGRSGAFATPLQPPVLMQKEITRPVKAQSVRCGRDQQQGVHAIGVKGAGELAQFALGPVFTPDGIDIGDKDRVIAQKRRRS